MCGETGVSKAASNPFKPGIDQLLIASALQPDLCRRLLECPEDVFQDFDLIEEQKDILRHPDHRLLGLLGAALARQSESTPPGPDASAPGPPPHAVIPVSKLPDLSLALTVAPYAQYDNWRFLGFAYAVWVNSIPAGSDPASAPRPAGTELAGQPLPPLHAVIHVSAAQMQDAAGNPQVGLWAALRQSSNISPPPPPDASGRIGNEPNSEAVQAAVTAVRQAPAHERFDRVIDLLRDLRGGGVR